MLNTLVYFNATNEVIEIINNLTLEIEGATLYSLLGTKVSQWKINSNELNIKIPTKNLERGVYIVKIKTNDNKYINQKLLLGSVQLQFSTTL